MDEFQDEQEADSAILKLFHILYLLKVLPFANYEVYGLEWGKRQAYIYRLLSAADRN